MRTNPRTAAGLLAGAVIGYSVAAWMVAPGFYDCCAPPVPYSFECPPAIAGADGGMPLSGRAVINVVGGVSDSDVAFSDDGQIVLGFLPGAFDVTGKTSVTVDISPVSPCPKPTGLQFATNTYLVTADAPLIKPASLRLVYSNLVPSPSYVYNTVALGGPWLNLGSSQQSAIWTIEPATPVKQLGYFAAGYPSNGVSRSPGSSQILPITVAVLIAAVLLAGIPLTVLRRRQARGGVSDDDDDDEPGGKT